jgi:biopolymer transport protein ExbD
MKKKKRGLQEINAGSMADIAFLLLIFFLITTTMASEQGILNLLPPKLIGDPPIIKQKNIMKILVNKDDNLLVEGQWLQIDELADATVKFLTNKGADPESSDSPDKAVISLKNDRGTSYDRYIQVQNELRVAYNTVRNDESIKVFGVPFEDLNDEQQKYIKKVIPQKISEAEPASIGGDL